MSIFAMVAFKGTDLTEISEQIQKMLGLHERKEKENGRWFEGKLTWEVSKTSSFAYSCGRWPLRAVVWMYEPNASLRCIYTRWSLSSHQRWSCRAGSCANGRDEWSSNRKRNFSFEDQIKISGDVFDVSHQPQTTEWLFLVCSELTD